MFNFIGNWLLSWVILGSVVFIKTGGCLKYLKYAFRSLALAVLLAFVPFRGHCADQIYTEFATEEFDNGKPNGVTSFNKLDCISTSKCSFSLLSFLCKQETQELKPLLDYYSTDLKTLRNLQISGNPKKISFEYSQYFGPEKIKCSIEMDSKSPILVKKAYCNGKGIWNAGTPYVRETMLINKSPFFLDEKCKGRIKFQ